MNNGKKITKEELESKLKEIYTGEEPWIQKCEWEEDGKIYHTWKFKMGDRGYGYTNDAGIAQINEAIKRDVENYLKDAEKTPKKESDTSEKE